MRKRPVVVGLIGGIGSGKSTVAALFKKCGAEIADADRLAHQALDQPHVMRQLMQAWGETIRDSGRVNREALAQAAFRTRSDQQKLNAIVHPAVLRMIRKAIRKCRKPVFVVDAPLLLEAGAGRDCDVVVFVDAPRSVRERRVASRGWKPAELRRRERLQWSLARKKRRADYVVENSGSRDHARCQVLRICRELLHGL